MDSSTSKKRKSTTGAETVAAKKARLEHDQARQLVASIISNPESNEMKEVEKDARDIILQLVRYARVLEEQVDATKPKVKSREEIITAAQRLKTVAIRGIEKQMSWKPSCKTGSAKFAYDGVCADPEVFGAVLGLTGPPPFKTKKYTVEEFEAAMGESVQGSVRYNTLYLRGNVNVAFKPDEGVLAVMGYKVRFSQSRDYS